MIRTGKKFSKPEMSRVINGDKELPEAPKKIEKIRLDHLLMEKFPEYKRASLQTFIKKGFVTVNGEIVIKANTKFLPTAEINLEIPKKEATFSKPQTIFEDENVLVLDKPAGMLSMTKGEYCPETTLENFGLIVHRLDRDTSGVVILAKNPETQKMLRRQFQERKTHKTYFTIVNGQPKLEEALIDLPIQRNLKKPTTFLVEAGGKNSQTYYKVLASNNQFSLVELKPTTGRTHQLRVHLKYIGTPIVGDTVYGSSKWQKTGERPRLFLHAKSLEITIPGKDQNERKVFESKLPDEFYEFLEKVGIKE